MKNNLKRIRENKGLEQAEVASDLGISLSTYRSWEQGSRGLNGEKLVMFAKYFGVTTDTILGTEFSDLVEEIENTPDEEELLAAYRGLSREGKSIALAVIAALVKSGNYSEQEA